MNAKDVILLNLDLSEMVLNSYIGDLDDAALTMRPAEGVNPIALQLGHLIESERSMVDTIKPGSCPALPAGFDAKHDLKSGSPDDASRYSSKSTYLALFQGQRAATKAALATISDAEFDQPAPEAMRPYAPTVAAVFNIVGAHVMMHAGQFVSLRRKLNKPVTI